MNEFGKFIKQIRESKNLTLTDVAEAAGINHSHLSRIESGDRNPPKAATMQKISVALGVSFVELMEKAGHWERLDEEEKLELARIYENDEMIERKMLSILRRITYDNGCFPGQIHKGIFKIFGDYLPLENDGYLKFNEWYKDNYLNIDEGDLTQSDHDYAYMEFNKYYNYSSIKNGIREYNGLLGLDDFLNELETFVTKNNIKNPNSDADEKEFISKLDLSDEEILERFDFALDGEELTDEEIKSAIAFLRTRRQMNP